MKTSSPVNAWTAAADADGACVATGAADGRIRVHDIAASKEKTPQSTDTAKLVLSLDYVSSTRRSYSDSNVKCDAYGCCAE